MTKAGCALFWSALLEIDCSKAVSQRCERAENVFCSRPGSFKVHCMLHGQGVGWDMNDGVYSSLETSCWNSDAAGWGLTEFAVIVIG